MVDAVNMPPEVGLGPVHVGVVDHTVHGEDNVGLDQGDGEHAEEGHQAGHQEAQPSHAVGLHARLLRFFFGYFSRIFIMDFAYFPSMKIFTYNNIKSSSKEDFYIFFKLPYCI